MKLNTIIQERRFDKRIVKWGLRHNMISAQEYQKHLKNLPDLANQQKVPQGTQKTSPKKTYTK